MRDSGTDWLAGAAGQARAPSGAAAAPVAVDISGEGRYRELRQGGGRVFVYSSPHGPYAIQCPGPFKLLSSSWLRVRKARVERRKPTGTAAAGPGAVSGSNKAVTLQVLVRLVPYAPARA